MSNPSRPSSPRAATSWRRWLGYFAIVVVFAVACVLLSRWQFARLDQVKAQIALVDANYNAPPVPIAVLLQPGSALEQKYEWRSVVVSGRYEPALQVLVRNRTHEGVTGFDIISPLRDDRGVLFVVDRGWIPTASDGRTPSAIPALPTQSVTVVARLRPTEPVLQGQSDTDALISSIHVAELATRWGSSTYTGTYGLLAEQKPPSTQGVLSSRPDISEGNHLSYALQWIAFAVLGFIALVWAMRNERKARSATPAKPRKQRTKTRPTDSEIEDALLDGR